MPIDLERLPETVSRKEFCRLTGIPPRSANRMVASGEIRVWRPAPGRRARYLKVEIARVLGTPYEGTRQSPRTPPAPAAV
jgi:hypothetical protein